MSNRIIVLVLIFVILQCSVALYPRTSESRDVVSLDGIWSFSLTATQSQTKALPELTGNVIPMPVPASYNDITEDKAIRDHVGPVWYQRKFFVPTGWSQGQRVWIRFGSVCYAAEVWINGQLVASHQIGHLPFEAEITSVVNFGDENVLTVQVDNTLLATTIPQGTLNQMTINNKTVIRQAYSFDFFNYAGIDRSVFLYSTPQLYINDVTVSTALASGNNAATVSYSLNYTGGSSAVTCTASLLDRDGSEVAVGSSCDGKLNVDSPKLWWPYLMDPAPGYLYSLKISATSDEGHDVYRQSMGIRSISWNNVNVLINGKPIYIRGFGRHEDSIIRGKGLDLSLIVKDYSLIKWIGANAYRTSHYPYAEEIMDMADQEGIMIIDECPSVNTELFSDTLQINHKQSLTELINRDKNRPSVVMWSIANEPRTGSDPAGPYFEQIANHVRSLDTSRPITIAMSESPTTDRAGEFLDVLSFNRYNSWYSDSGLTEIITDYVMREARSWRTKLNKPVLVTEYGADTMPGLHVVPEVMWSEEYQVVLMEEHFKAFDTLRQEGWFIGEMIWNFADFMTAQTITRVGGNRKGIFTRDRQPKASAHLLRKRNFDLANELDNATIPSNIHGYTSSRTHTHLDL